MASETTGLPKPRTTRKDPGSMNIKKKAALTALSLNILLTGLKFVLYSFSGSLAVLMEAWHSFSDIGTSFMLFLAVRKSDEPGAGGPGETTVTTPKKGIARLKGITFEQIVSIGIGVLLLIVAISLMVKFFTAIAAPVRSPLIAGLIFIGFSIGSFLVYRFETAVGRKTNSVGLLSDGMHALTDMMASLLTGFSLILYHLGFNIDRWVAGAIALLVLSFAIETIVNAAVSISRKESEALFKYKTYALLAHGFSPKSWARAGEFLDRHFRIRFFGNALVRKAPRYLFFLIGLCFLVYWASTTSFVVLPSEEAVIERLGEPLHPETPLGPGLYLKAPWPVDRAVKVETQTIRTMNIGNTPDAQAFALLWTRTHGAANPFLSGENDYFYPYVVLHYRVKDLNHFLYRQKDPEKTLEGVANQVATQLFAKRRFYEIALSFRRKLVEDLKTHIQLELDQLETGIELIDATIIDIHPPIDIADAYERVIASYQEKEQMINQALGYRNQKLPEARGQAVRNIEEAESYATEKPLRAQGDAKKLHAQSPENASIAKITRKRLYLSAMLEALKGRKIILVDPKTGVPELWLNMTEFFGSPKPAFDSAEF